MFNFLKRKKRLSVSTDEALIQQALIVERQSFRDNELHLIRRTITNRRKEIASNMHLNASEKRCMINSLDVVEKHALDVAFLTNRERMQELGAPKQRRASHLPGVDMGL